ncbi:MAG: GNAT family N-acetyltransferase [Planctomycetota bacterium]|jgi:predicted N-acetyltransferase YhbS
MGIQQYEPSMLGDLALLYSRAVGPVPHCHPVSGDEFSKALVGLGGLAGDGKSDGSSDKRMRAEAVLVATEDDRAVGFAHVGIGRLREGASDGEDTETEQGIIRFLWHERGGRAAGQALVAAAENALRARGAARVLAFTQMFRYPFYHLGYAYVSNAMDHVQALLAFSGYRRVDGEVFLDWPDFEPPGAGRAEGDAGPGVSFVVETRPGRGRLPGLAVRAMRGDAELGHCVSVSAAEYAGAADEEDWLFTKDLWVTEAEQGRGLGKALLGRSLAEARPLGYRHAAISTDWRNHRALLFYSNFGYAVVDWTYGFGRELES